jgi:energy-converting hydrogenase Eha subunit C
MKRVDLIGIVGLLLIFGAFKPHSRPLILVLSIVSKTIFIGLILTYGNDYLETARGAIVFDSIAILLYLIYLITNHKELKF